MKTGRTRIWIKEYGGWIGKIICALVIGATTAATWWMFLTFQTVEKANKFQERYWSNRKDDIKQLLDVDKRVMTLETKEQSREADERRRKK